MIASAWLEAGLTPTVLRHEAPLAELREQWLALQERSEADEPMLSPSWLLTWWRIFGGLDGRQLRVVLFRRGEELVGLAPLLLRSVWHRRLIPFRRLEPLGTGEAEADAVCPDYLNVLAQRGAESAVAAALSAMLADGTLGDWDELVIPNMNGEGVMPSQLAEALSSMGCPAQVSVTDAAPYIPLPSSWDAYLKTLSPSRRYYVNRSLRDFEKWAGGPADVRCATTPAELAEGRDILVRLHQGRWNGAGDPGKFSSPRFTAFHEAVQAEFLQTNAVELLWLCVRGEPVAAVYNIVWKGKVYFYQSGRKMDVPEETRLGVVLHAHAIRRSIEQGRREYDFLAGATRYKTQLALASRPLVQLRAVRPSWRAWASHTLDGSIARARIVRNWLRTWPRLTRPAPLPPPAPPCP
jgi:CelD/BcsL family acetyltransferase involved in cellulose biosynthesis